MFKAEACVLAYTILSILFCEKHLSNWGIFAFSIYFSQTMSDAIRPQLIECKSNQFLRY